MSDNILALHGLIAGFKSSDKQSLINIVNAAEANQSTIKTNIATGLNSKTGSSLTSSSAWIDIQNVINNLNGTNKKWKSGTISGILTSQQQITVTGLPFVPKIIIFMYVKSGNPSTIISDVALKATSANGASGWITSILKDLGSASGLSISVDTEPTTNAFTLKGGLYTYSSDNAININWLAFEG